MKKLSIILLIAMCGYQASAQVSISANAHKSVYAIKGDYYFGHNNDVMAISNYSKSLRRNPKDTHAMLNMAEAYHRRGDDSLAVQWYSKAFSLNPDIEDAYVLKYISVLHKIENYDTLRHWMTIYNKRISKTSPTDLTTRMRHDSTLVLIHNFKTINSSESDLGPALYNDQLIFSSARANNHNVNYNLYTTVRNQGLHEAPVLLHQNLNSGISEGPVTIAQKTKKLFFTGTGQPQADKKALMEIFCYDLPANPSDKIKIEKLPVRNFDNGMSHPAANSEGTVMFFTSNNPKNDRGFDLYKIEYNGKNWSAPRALSSDINTDADEMYPVLHNDSTLYFSSNRHGGLGGFDIYKVNIYAKHGKVEHLHAPINAPSDDFELLVSNDGTEGYLASNRPGGLGKEDLYKIYFLTVKSTKPLSETVAENIPKPEVLSLYTSSGSEIKLTASYNKGNLAFEFVPGMSYTLIMDYENHSAGTMKPNSNKTALPKRNAYTFEIQKLSRSLHDEKEKGLMVRDVHINPGDLVTFQLIPNGKAADAESSNSKIHFYKDEATIKLGDTIVFSYVAEAGPDTSKTIDTDPVADSNGLNTKNLSQNDKVSDTVILAEDVIAKNIQSDKTMPDAGMTPSIVEPVVTSLQDPETVGQTLTASSEENIHTTAGSEPLTKTDQQVKLENINQATGDPIPSVSEDKKNVIADNEQAEDLSQVSPANEMALQSKVSSSSPSTIAEDLTGNDGQNNNFEYRVQIAAARTELTAQQLKRIYNGQKEINFFREAGYYKYTIETTSSYPEAQRILKESGVGHAFISAYKGDTKWDLKKAIAHQNKEGLKGTQPDIGDKNTETSAEAVETANLATNTIHTNDTSEDNGQLIARHFLTGVDESADEPGIMNNISGNPVTVNQSDDTLIQKEHHLRDSLNAKDISVKSNQDKDVAQFRNTIAQTTEPVEQNPPTNNANNTASITNMESVQQNGLETTTVTDVHQLTASLNRNHIFPNENTQEDTAQFLSDKIITSEATEQKGPDHKTNKAGHTLIDGTTVDSGSSLLQSTSEYVASDTPDKNAFEFRIQIAASRSKISEAQLKKIYNGPNEIHRFKEDGYYKYTIESTPSYPEAQRILKESDVDQAFISAYKGDAKWNLKEAIAFQNSRPILTDITPYSPDERDAPASGSLQYRIQIAASRRKISDVRLRNEYNGPKEIRFFSEDGYYKYYIDETPNYYIARKTLKDCHVDSAFISAYRGNAKYPLQNALASQYKTPIIQSELAETDSVVTIVTVNFELDEFELLPDERSHLREHVVNRLKTNNSWHVIVNGYTDVRGSEVYNFGLSQERAHFVEQLIIAEGISPESVTTQYFGESQLIKYCPTNETCDDTVHQVNRRVEILLLMNKDR